MPRVAVVASAARQGAAPARVALPRIPKFAAACGLALLLGACSLTRQPELPPGAVVAPPAGIDLPAAAPAPGQLLADIASQFLGAPYRYGGDSPASGFDCSGLVLHVHELAGLAVPRTALGQRQAARPVPTADLQPGDLVFFASRRGAVDHVGIYAGDGRFLHAPRTGRPVGYDRLDDLWFATRYVGAGRFWTAPPAAAATPQAP